MCRAGKWKNAGMWKHNGCGRCCVVHPRGWRLAACALSGVGCNTGRDEIKWHGADRFGLKFSCCMRKKMFSKAGGQKSGVRRRRTLQTTSLPAVTPVSCLLVRFLHRNFFCCYACWVLFYLRWRGKLRGIWFSIQILKNEKKRLDMELSKVWLERTVSPLWYHFTCMAGNGG